MSDGAFFGTLRTRVIGLAALPPIVVMAALTIQWHRHELADARASALDIVRRASAAHDRKGRPSGVPLARWLSEFAEQATLPPGAVITVFDDTGAILEHIPEVVLTEGGTAIRPLVDAAIVVGAEGVLEATVFDGVRRTFAFGPLPGAGGTRRQFVSVGLPNALVTAEADRILKMNALGFGVALLFTVAGASFMGHRFVTHHVEAQLRDRSRIILEQHDRLLVQEHRFRSMLENSTEGIALWDADGDLKYLSPSTERILGYSPGELLTTRVQEYVHPEDRSHVAALLGQIKDSRADCCVSSRFRFRHQDGTWRWLAVDVQNLLDEPALTGILGHYRDITLQLSLQSELRASRDALEQRVRERTAALTASNDKLRKLSHAIEQTADSVFITDRQGVIEYANPAFEALTGYSRSEAIGHTPRLFASGLHNRAFFEALWRTILSGRSFRTIVTNRRKDGTLFAEDQTVTPLRDEDGSVTHFVSTGRDITARKRTEQAVRRLNSLLEEQTARIAGLLHDEAGQFLTSAHILLSDIARDVAPETRERLGQVRRHLDEVEQQLRTVSHELHPRILTDLGLVGTLRFRAQGFARRTGIETHVNAAEEPVLAPTLQATIYRMVQEAMTNAGKYSRARMLTVTLNGDARTIACTVRDDGIGFDVQDLFQRNGDKCLGLRGMCDRVEAAGGTLEIVSAPGEGTEIRARLPLEG